MQSLSRHFAHARLTSPSRLVIASANSPQQQSTSSESSSSLNRQSRTRKEQPQSFSSVATPCGQMHLIMGPMFAGKTTELLRRVREAQSQGKATAIIKPLLDQRYNKDSVTTHAGDTLSCHTIERLVPLLLPSGDELSGSSQSFLAAKSAFTNADVVCIDEAQFFPDLVDFATQAVEVHGKELLIAGLDGDFKRKRFGHLIELIPLADSVLKVKGRCHFCEKESLFSFRTSKEMKQELIGGEEAYVPTCRDHYVSLSRNSGKRW